ncbi:MAG: dynamin family protein [Clostridia bacterium]|nr:dynamin family protein [Clostridia bacterium]
MNYLKLYHILHSMNDIICKYPDATDVYDETTALLERMSSNLYKVAVVGEFKRGKSSLINALMGTNILPTDILPATAVINRIVYDTEQKIIINYKDGTTEETTVAQLENYATKLDEDKEQTAMLIDEISVHYPSVFGQNGIELIDTPGLNDDEHMTKRTLEIIGKTDTALVVIAADKPLSQTEQTIIHDLILQPGIFHLTFVVTFIDKISDEESEQNRIVEVIKKRISENTLESFCKKYGDDAELLKKAESILCDPDIFAVSAKLAINGFLKNDMNMIKESRFPEFKTNLLAILTANNELDILSNAMRLINKSKSEISAWCEKRSNALTNSLTEFEKKLEAIIELIKNRETLLNDDMKEFFTLPGDYGVVSNYYDGPDIEKKVCCVETFAKHLYEITTDDYCESAINNALDTALIEINERAKIIAAQSRETFERQKEIISQKISERYNALTDNALKPFVFEKIFPALIFPKEDITAAVTDIMGDIIVPITQSTADICKKFGNAYEEYINNFTDEICDFENNATQIIKDMGETIVIQINDIKEKIETVSVDSKNDINSIMLLAVGYSN